jgi:hypothetical protein
MSFFPKPIKLYDECDFVSVQVEDFFQLLNSHEEYPILLYVLEILKQIFLDEA